MNTQLLCTFCPEADLEKTIQEIVNTYDISRKILYVLTNTEIENSLCCTYNINIDSKFALGGVPESTISLHRKKMTNTLYTINALNMLIEQLNGGKRDVNFKVPWEEYNNTILVSAYGKLRKIKTKLVKIVDTSKYENK